MNSAQTDLTAGFYSLFNSLVNKSALVEIRTKNGAAITGTIEAVDFNMNFVLKESELLLVDGTKVA
jgi:small nuclear ribonucleoprotein (snRNP)-like protein